jgi:hypothetical protein
MDAIVPDPLLALKLTVNGNAAGPEMFKEASFPNIFFNQGLGQLMQHAVKSRAAPIERRRLKLRFISSSKSKTHAET